MKYMVFICTFILFGCLLYSQSDIISERPRPIFWKNFNQRERVKTEKLRFRYPSQIPEDISYVRMIPTLNPGEFFIELQTDAYQTKVQDMELPLSVEIPDKDTPPRPGRSISGAASRVITFDTVGQSYLVFTGEIVNIQYKNIDTKKTFIKYSSVEEGYYIQLLETSTPTPVNFTKLCEKYIVASPSKTIIMVDNALKYEQIVWTPMDNGQWEVRIGTTGREGCSSPALENINKLRNPDYIKNRPWLIKK
jgi:hypothetical protein